MLVFVDTTYGSTFHIELNPNDKVLDIKNKIENSQGIHVSMQTLYYNGEPLLIDDLDLNTYNIVPNSRLLLVLPYQQEDDNNQVLQPTTVQSLAHVQDSLEEFQDWSATARSIFRQMLDQPEHSPEARCAMGRHDDKKNQDLVQSEAPSFTPNTFGEDLPLPPTEKSIDNSNVFHTEPSNTFGNLLFGEEEDTPLSTEHFANIKSFGSASTDEDIFINMGQGFPTEQRSNTQTTEKPPVMKEVIDVPDSPVKKVRRFRKPPQRLRVMVLPHSPDNESVSKVPVSVMANGNVEELRKELEKLRDRKELKLPEKGYFFIHKQNVLDDDRSFLWNGVAHGDTIEIFPGYVTKDGRTFGL